MLSTMCISIYIYTHVYHPNPLHQVVPECESMPNSCYELKWPWAVGSEPVVFPAEVGGMKVFPKHSSGMDDIVDIADDYFHDIVNIVDILDALWLI